METKINKYILKKEYALRGWNNIPRALIRKDHKRIRTLNREEFSFLLRCDGAGEISGAEAEPLIRDFLEKGIILPVFPGNDARLNEWQEYHYYDNEFRPFMNIEITRRCNYHCLHCFNEGGKHAAPAEISYENIIKILDEAKDIGVQAILITGGEPLCHPRFMDILKAVYDRNMHVFEINTNGVLLTKELLSRIKETGCRALMKISFDGLGFHDWMRNSAGAQSRALKAIRDTIDSGFRAMVQMNINRVNKNAVLPSLSLLDEMGVSHTRIIRTTEAPEWKKNAGDGCLGWTEYYTECLKAVAGYLSRGNRKMSVNCWEFLTVDPVRKRFSADPVRYNKETFRPSMPLCKCVKGMISISAEGNLLPCMMQSGGMEKAGLSLENIFDRRSPGGLIKKGTYARAVQFTIADKIQKNPKCASCPFLTYCGGGCTALSQLCESNYFGSDHAKCIFFRDGWHKRIASALPGYEDLAPISDEDKIDYSAMMLYNIDEHPACELYDDSSLINGYYPKH